MEAVVASRAVARFLRLISLVVCLPYCLGHAVLPALGFDPEAGLALWRGWLPLVVVNVVVVSGGWRAVKGFGRLHDSIRDSVYLIGRRLHNLD